MSTHVAECTGEIEAVPLHSQRKHPNIRFPGQYFDAETGLHYNFHRYYDPSVGRYISADPIGQFGGLALDGVLPELRFQPGRRGSVLVGVGAPDANLYRYGLSNPLAYADPLGLWSVSITAFSHGWGGVGGRVSFGSDDNGAFFDAIVGVGVGAGISFDPNGEAPIGPQNFDSCEIDPDEPIFYLGAGAAAGGIAGPASAGGEGFAGGIVGTDSSGNVAYEYEERGGSEFGVGSVGLGGYGVGGIRIGGSGL